MNISTELTELKEKIERKERELQDAETRIEMIIEQLQKDFDVSTIDEAEKVLKSLEKKEQTLTSKIENLIEEIKDV